MSQPFRLSPLEPRIPIKNTHTVLDLQVHANKQIFVVYESAIHIHSMGKLVDEVPSLVYVIELGEVVQGMSRDAYQDGLTGRIISSGKSAFGEVVFGKELAPDTNALMKVGHFKERLRYLGGQFLRVRKLCIHPLGHLLLTFEDNRGILIKRTSPGVLLEYPGTLYNTNQPIIINQVLASLVTACRFTGSSELSIVCVHALLKKPDENVLSLVTFSDKDSPSVTAVMWKRLPLVLTSKGLIGMEYLQGKDETAWVVLLYYNRLEVVGLSRSAVKGKSMHALSFKQADFTKESGFEFFSEYWLHQKLPSEPTCRSFTLYLPLRSSVWRVTLNFAHDPPAWTYTLATQPKPPQSQYFHLNHRGEQLEHTPSPNSHPNHVVNLAAETDCGLVVQLQASTGDYKKGWLEVMCPGVEYVLSCMQRRVWEWREGVRGWVDFWDLYVLNRDKNLRKELLTALSELRKKEKQSLDCLLINAMSILQNKKRQKLTELIQSAIRRHLSLAPDQQIDPAYCVLSHQKITVEDVLRCKICHTFSIKQKATGRCCYICCNLLYSL